MAASKQPRLLDAGKRAPEFRLQRLEGGESTLQNLISTGPVLLAFFKISCPVCQFTLPYLERLHQGGYRVYGISQDNAEDTREFHSEFGVTFPTLLDDEEADFPASNAYGISHVPTLFLVEPDGTIARVIEGWNRQDMEWLGTQAGVRVIRAGENVPAWKAG